MRIAIITTNFPVLSETFISNKVKALLMRGHTVRVFTGNQNKVLFNKLFKNTSSISVVEFTVQMALLYCITHPFSILKSINQKNRKRYLYRSFRLYAISQFQPDIIHFEFSGLGTEYIFLLDQLECKKVVSCRGSAEKVKLLVSQERKTDFARLMQQVDSVHCVSNDMRNTIKEYIDLKKAFINFPSIDVQYFTRVIPYQTNQIPIIISIGRFIFPKNYLIGLLAMKCIADSGKKFKWLIIASGPQYDEIVFHIHQLQLQDFVDLVGTKEHQEIKKFLEKADVFFLPSVYEGIANVALEAMSMELPVVSTTCGGMPEVITCGKNGLMADVYDYKKLGEHIMYLLNHPEQARAMGKAARERILEAFTVEQQTDTFERIYQQLLTA
jgi:colanic acid/amylovoran biosynthesis glycosyltransferase